MNTPVSVAWYKFILLIFQRLEAYDQGAQKFGFFWALFPWSLFPMCLHRAYSLCECLCLSLCVRIPLLRTPADCNIFYTFTAPQFLFTEKDSSGAQNV